MDYLNAAKRDLQQSGGYSYSDGARTEALIAIAQELRAARQRKSLILPSGAMINLDHILIAKWVDPNSPDELQVWWAGTDPDALGLPMRTKSTGDDANAIARALGMETREEETSEHSI